jgi:uncharacterized lipoprotein YehR (DUF1307 family)
MRKFFLAVCAAIIALSVMGCQKRPETHTYVAHNGSETMVLECQVKEAP